MSNTLIECSSLLSQLRSSVPLIFDCRFNLADTQWGQREYQQGHLPHAFYLHLDDDLSSPITSQSGRHPLPDPIKLTEHLINVGLTPERPVVVYDELSGVMAARAWWLLRWLGHENVTVLNGGLAAWLAAGGTLQQTHPEPLQQGHFQQRLQTDQVVQTETLVAQLQTPPSVTAPLQLVDARSAERFRGELEPIDPIAGHIPGAINRPLTDNLTADGRFKTPAQLKAEWLPLIQQQSPAAIVHMCGSGVTACHNNLAMEIAGLTGSKLYAGSWSEWIRDTKRPIALGD